MHQVVLVRSDKGDQNFACICGDVAPNLALVLGTQIQGHGVASLCNVPIQAAKRASCLALEGATDLYIANQSYGVAS